MIELRRRYSEGVQSPSFSRLPAGYQEVEYLESTGTQYIKTGVIYNKDEIATIKIDCMLVQKNDNFNSCPYGFYRGSVSSSVSTEFSIGGALKISASALYDIIEQPLYESLKRYSIVVNGEDGTSVNGNILESSTHKIIETTLEIPLFTRDPNGRSFTLEVFKGKIYCCKFYKDYKIIRDFVPCYRTLDRIAGMYDIVNDVFYVNVGTGEFLVGPDVHYNIPFEYQEVEYLDNQQNPMAYLVIPQIKRGFNGKIIGKVSVPSNSIQLSNFSYKMAFGWNDGPQATAVLSGTKMYWGNYNISGYLVEIDKLYELTLEINASVSTLYVGNVLSVINYTFNNDGSLYIFNGHALNLSFLGKVYSIKTEGTENIHLIPCYRKEDNVAGMYDIVNGVFYTNAGTGVFTVGPDVIG